MSDIASTAQIQSILRGIYSLIPRSGQSLLILVCYYHACSHVSMSPTDVAVSLSIFGSGLKCGRRLRLHSLLFKFRNF